MYAHKHTFIVICIHVARVCACIAPARHRPSATLRNPHNHSPLPPMVFYLLCSCRPQLAPSRFALSSFFSLFSPSRIFSSPARAHLYCSSKHRRQRFPAVVLHYTPRNKPCNNTHTHDEYRRLLWLYECVCRTRTAFVVLLSSTAHRAFVQ